MNEKFHYHSKFSEFLGIGKSKTVEVLRPSDECEEMKNTSTYLIFIPRNQFYVFGSGKNENASCITEPSMDFKLHAQSAILSNIKGKLFSHFV
jgi:hypothetical protein